MKNEQVTQLQSSQIQQTDFAALSQEVEAMSRGEREQQERAREKALPFAERTEWRRRHLYRGWMLEPVELRSDPAIESLGVPRSRSRGAISDIGY